MNATSNPPRKRIQPIKALRAIRALLRDPDDTPKVFEIIDALSGNSGERIFRGCRAPPTGGRTLREQGSLLPPLDDREALKALPPGSLGRTYAEFAEREQITGQGLADASLAAPRRPDLGPERRLFFDR